MTRTPVQVAGLVLTRDEHSNLHAGTTGLPESFPLSSPTLQVLRLKHNPEAYIAPTGELVIRTNEDSAVYRISAPDAHGTHLAIRYA